MGAFTRSLAPFGAGQLNIEDAYRIEQPTETPTPPTPEPPPPREVGGSPQTVPNPKPPKVGKTPIPRTTAKKPVRRVVKRPITRRVVVATKRPVPKPPIGHAAATAKKPAGAIPHPPVKAANLRGTTARRV